MVEFPGQPSAALLERNRELPGYSHLGASLGGMFFNGGANDARQQQIFNSAARGQVDLDSAIMADREKRDQYMSRHSMAERLRETDPNAADFALQGNLTAQGLSQYFKDNQDVARKAALDKAARDPNFNWNTFNPQLAAYEGKPQEVTKAVGGANVNPLETPGTHAGIETLFQTADRVEQEKLGRSHDAAANASNASAERQRAGIDADKAGFYQYFTNPDDGSIWKVDARDSLHPQKVGGEEGFGGAHMYKVGTEPKGGAAAAKTLALPHDVMSNMLGGDPTAAGIVRPDPTKVRAFTEWRQGMIDAGHPEFRDPTVATAAWERAYGKPNEPNQEMPPGVAPISPSDLGDFDWLSRHGGVKPQTWADRESAPDTLLQPLVPTASAPLPATAQSVAPPTSDIGAQFAAPAAAAPAAAAPAPAKAAAAATQSLQGFMAYAKAHGSKMTDAQLKEEFALRQGKKK